MGIDVEARLSSSSSSPSESHFLEAPLLSEDIKRSTSSQLQQPLSSQPKTFANVFIAVVGAGVLGLPYTFKKTGWLVSLIMILSIGFLTYYCMMLLVYTRRKLEARHGLVNIASFGDLGYAVSGPVGRFSVDCMIVLSQAGFCIGYLIFIGNTLANLYNSPTPSDLTPHIWGMLPKSWYIWACFPFQLGLNSIATLTHMAPLSIFADVVDLGAMGVVMVEDVVVFLRDRPAVQAVGGISTFFYALGVAVYSFEGVGMALPLESETEEKDKYGRVLGLTMTFIALMYGGFGLLGYFAYGAETKDIITANMGFGTVSIVVQLGLCINLFFTFPLMMHPVYEVVERRFCDGQYCMWIRWILVLAVSLVALFVPNFTDFLSLVGSSICCTLGFVLPSLFHLLVFKEEMGYQALFTDGALVVLGVVLGVSGTWCALVEILSLKA